MTWKKLASLLAQFFTWITLLLQQKAKRVPSQLGPNSCIHLIQPFDRPGLCADTDLLFEGKGRNPRASLGVMQADLNASLFFRDKGCHQLVKTIIVFLLPIHKKRVRRRGSAGGRSCLGGHTNWTGWETNGPNKHQQTRALLV